MTESRLFKILYYLLDKGYATAPELASRFEVSVRTIYRDIDALSSAGIPIYTETGRKGGVRLLGDFVLDKIIMSRQEKQEILSALQGLSSISGESKEDTLEKLSAFFHIHSVNWLEADFSRWGVESQDNSKFQLLKTAVIHNRCLKILYADSYGKTTKRTIQPLKLFYKSRDWYLKAFCQTKQGFRLFKISRILKWELLEEQFTPVAFPETMDAQSDTCRQITLSFPKEIAYRVYDEFDIDQIQLQKDGSLVVSAQMPEDDWLTGFLLSFGTQVEIIEPLSLKNTVTEKVLEMYKKYKP
ncbi:MAG: YafY family transcriptional regulator [Lachnospiraceae bacterium]|nr:YafY family transcriptional regulator [Lachnospiraceae bacterium]